MQRPDRYGVKVIIHGGESAKNLNRPGLKSLLALVDSSKVEAVIVAKLDRLTRSAKDLCSLLELFEKRGVALVSVAESLDTPSAAGRLMITIMAAVSQWEREAIGERTRDALAAQAHQWGSNQIRASKACSRKSVTCARAATRCEGSRPP